jgi:hypothetical protein
VGWGTQKLFRCSRWEVEKGIGSGFLLQPALRFNILAIFFPLDTESGKKRKSLLTINFYGGKNHLCKRYTFLKGCRKAHRKWSLHGKSFVGSEIFSMCAVFLKLHTEIFEIKFYDMRENSYKKAPRRQTNTRTCEMML